MHMTKPVLPMTGGCQCGAIRYEIGGFPLLLYTCNCTDCQRQSGSAFAFRGFAASARHGFTASGPDARRPSTFARERSTTPRG